MDRSFKDLNRLPTSVLNLELRKAAVAVADEQVRSYATSIADRTNGLGLLGALELLAKIGIILAELENGRRTCSEQTTMRR